MVTVAYAGCRIKADVQVKIFNLETRRPVYHAAGGQRDEGELGWALITRCGLWTAQHGLGVAPDSRGRWIPTRHALRFARPCRRCWPELALNATLELELLEGPLPARGG